ncbi:MAG: VWA domain-containing protein [bacterium]|nr:VWA domain-containing protein [bacterium]
MKRPTTYVAVFFALFMFCFVWSLPAASPDFTVNIPDRYGDSGGTDAPIRQITVTVDILPSAPPGVDMEIENPTAEVQSLTINTTPGTVGFVVFASGDSAVIQALNAGVPGVKRFEINLDLTSNWTGCFDGSAQAGAETWEFRVTNTQFAGVCVNSYEVSGGDCTGSSLLQAGDGPATVVGFPGAQIACASERPPVDVMLVLDKSGSMGWAVTGAMPPKIKMDSLHTSLQNFVRVWDDVESAGDRVGAVLFSGNASDWTFPAVGPLPALNGNLNGFSDNLSTAIDTNAGGITAGGSTSIGDGLKNAADYLVAGAGAGNRQVILLLSDGKQNANFMVGLAQDDGDYNDDAVADGTPDQDGDGSSADDIPVLYNKDGTGYQPLPGLADCSIWTISVGAAVDIDAGILQDVASNTDGFYINTEDDPDLLNIFFLELLQNFLRFNTIETTEMRADSIPNPGHGGEVEFLVNTSSTAKKLVFNLMWRRQYGLLSMKVFLPNNTEVDSSYFDTTHPGSICMATPLPTPPSLPKGALTGPWRVKIKAVRASGNMDKFPFYFHAMADDDAVKSVFEIPFRDYQTGAPIPLQVKLKEFGTPVLNTNGLTVKATVAMPGQGIGELLSNNTASGTPPVNPDLQAGSVDEKLHHLLQVDPDLLGHASSDIELFDDGKSVHGDAVKDDGIYSNLFTQTEHAGHYTFLFSAEGNTQKTGPIMRKQMKSVHVRPAPSPQSTEAAGTATVDGQRRYFTLTLTPKDKKGHKLGPGYANYFIPRPLKVGGTDIKFTDKNMDGVYKLHFSLPVSEAAPDISVDFVKPSMIITDEMFPEKIPRGLRRPFITHFPIEGGAGGGKGFYLSLHGGLNLPHPNLDVIYDGKFSVAVDFEYKLADTFSLLLFAGYNKFESKISSFIGDLKILNVSLNGKFYVLSRGNLSIFLNGGGGMYFLNPGDDKFGFNLGGGLQLRLTNRLALESWYNFHNIFTTGTATKFSTVQAGFNIRF